MRPSHISQARDTYPALPQTERPPAAEGPSWAEPPASLQLELERDVSLYGAVTRALWAAGWSRDAVSILGRFVVTSQGPGLYYCGIVRDTRLTLHLWEDM